MNRQERLSALVEVVVDKGSVSVEQVVHMLGVSPATARRDLDALAEQQLVVRTRGGASSNPSTGELPLRYRGARNWREKEAIARYAASLIVPSEVIGVNGGTTTTAIAHAIGVRIASEEVFSSHPITLVTNAVNIANDLTIRPQARVVVTGGVARSQSYELVGPLSSLILPEIRIDTLFLGVNGVDFESGCYTHSEDEASVNAALVKAAKRTIVVADSTKLGATAFARICGFDEVHTLLTEASADPAAVSRLQARGVHVVLV